MSVTLGATPSNGEVAIGSSKPQGQLAPSRDAATIVLVVASRPAWRTGLGGFDVGRQGKKLGTGARIFETMTTIEPNDWQHRLRQSGEILICPSRSRMPSIHWKFIRH